MGATSGIGACTVREAAHRGIPVRAFARSADKLASMDGVEPMAGDARSPEDVRRAVKGVRAIVYALGIRERLSMLWQEETLFSESTRILLREMETEQVRRLVAVTGFGAGRSRRSMSRIERLGHRAILGKPYADKDRQEALIMDSDLDWTIVRPVILTNGRATGRFKVLRNPDDWRNGVISRADVARYVVDCLDDDTVFRRDVVIAR